jgi:SpoIID/LytB domain protein
VIPQTDGFELINEVYCEDLIPALLATKVQDVTEPSALEALAVVLRSALLQAVSERKEARYHITDNDDTFVFRGINLVFKDLLEASQNSSQIRLTQSFADAYDSCGTVTADTLENTAQKPDYVYSPSNVSKYMLSNPPEDLFSRPQDPTQWSRIKWMYLYEAKDITGRIAYKQNIGNLRALVPTKVSPNGRVLMMRFEGSKGSYEAKTPQEILFLLSAGTMRSNFFDIVPFYKGKNIQRILVRGYDTGFGKGLCVRGADGLAKNGADYMAIIKYYFPQARILNTTTGMIN